MGTQSSAPPEGGSCSPLHIIHTCTHAHTHTHTPCSKLRKLGQPIWGEAISHVPCVGHPLICAWSPTLQGGTPFGPWHHCCSETWGQRHPTQPFCASVSPSAQRAAPRVQTLEFSLTREQRATCLLVALPPWVESSSFLSVTSFIS